jgi:hypothetical protein
MSGRANAQGMKNKHYVMGKLKFMMGRVINTLGWVSKLLQRQQIICLLPNIHRKRKLVEEKTVRTGKRGPYKSRGLVTRKNESSLEATDCDEGDNFGDDTEIEVPEGYFLAEGNTLLPNEIGELYNFLTRRQAPENFLEAVSTDETMGNVAKMQMQNF